MARTVFSITPSSRPRQPAWTAATTVPPRSHSNTGRQSAVSTAHTTSLRRTCLASASRSRCTAAASTAVMPCTCCSQCGTAGRCSARCNRRRFSATCRGSSPTWVARLSDAYGPSLTPPRRVVLQARTCAGAGPSGASQANAAGKSLTADIVTQQRQKVAHITSQRRLPSEICPGARMDQAQGARVQCLALELLQGGAQRVAAAGGRLLAVRHVYADLVGT